MMRTRSGRTTCWLPGLPPGSGVGIEITVGPVLCVPFPPVGVFCLGMVVVGTVPGDCDDCAPLPVEVFLPGEPQATSNKNATSIAPSSINFFGRTNIPISLLYYLPA